MNRLKITVKVAALPPALNTSKCNEKLYKANSLMKLKPAALELSFSDTNVKNFVII